MTRNTLRPAVLCKLIEMNFLVTRFTFRRQTAILHTLHAVTNRFPVAVGAFHMYVHSDEGEFRFRMIKRGHFPRRSGMTFCAAVFGHLLSELSLMEILVARFTSEVGKMK